MLQDKLFFGHAVSGLFQEAIGERMTPELRAQLRDAGIDISVAFHPLSPSEFELHLNDVVGIPDFFSGLVEGGAIASCRAASVNVSRLQGEGCVLLYRAQA